MISLIELFRIAIVTVSIGYIFSGFIKNPLKKVIKSNDWKDIKFSIAVAAPAIILHEMAHKFLAIFYGVNAEFFASYFGLGIGVFLKLIGSPFLIFVPGFVLVSGATVTQGSLIAFAGPLTNLLLWGGATFLLLMKVDFSRKQLLFLFYTKRINMILFLFNMIPFGPFDGAKVFAGLIGLFS